MPGNGISFCHVVSNAEDQHSLWPEDADLPAGWHPTGFRGPAATCLAHIDQAWPDMRPRSLRLQMAEEPDDPAAKAVT